MAFPLQQLVSVSLRMRSRMRLGMLAAMGLGAASCGPLLSSDEAGFELADQRHALLLPPVDAWGGASWGRFQVVNGSSMTMATLSVVGDGFSATATTCGGIELASPFRFDAGGCVLVTVLVRATAKTGSSTTGEVRLRPQGREGLTVEVTAPVVDGKRVELCSTGHSGDDPEWLIPHCVTLRPGELFLPLGFSGSASGVLKRLRLRNGGEDSVRIAFVQPLTASTALASGPLSSLSNELTLSPQTTAELSLVVSALNGRWSLPAFTVDGHRIELLDNVVVPQVSPVCLPEQILAVRAGRSAQVDVPLVNCASFPLPLVSYQANPPLSVAWWAPSLLEPRARGTLPFQVAASTASATSLVTILTGVSSAPVARALFQIRPIEPASCELKANPVSLGVISPGGTQLTVPVTNEGGVCGPLELRATGVPGGQVHFLSSVPPGPRETATWSIAIEGPLPPGPLEVRLEVRLPGNPTAADLSIPVRGTVSQ